MAITSVRVPRPRAGARRRRVRRRRRRRRRPAAAASHRRRTSDPMAVFEKKGTLDHGEGTKTKLSKNSALRRS
jgi:hypothetical protein